MNKRVLLINDDGTATVGGVKCKLVPKEPTDYYYEWDSGFGLRRSFSAAPYNGMPPNRSMPLLSAAAIDLSGLPRVPERPSVEPRDTEYDKGVCAGYGAALDAIGVKSA